MNRSTLKDLLAPGEGFTTEFQRSGTSNLGRKICAFANAAGGVILIGVKDNGEVTGVSDLNRLKSEVQTVARSAEPPIAIEVEELDNVLCVTVPPQQSKPYSFAGKFFIREGTNSQQMSREEIRSFFYKEGLIHFDETPCDRFSPESDLTPESWSIFCNRAKIPSNIEPVIALKNLHLVRDDGKMTNAGAWLLASDICKFSISAGVDCALFMGSDKVKILDRRNFNRDVYSIIDDVVAYILSKMNEEDVVKHVKKEERPELPEEAIREAVVNAIAHRDYRSTANIQIYIFEDRLEIVNPGGLPAGMEEADLGARSIPRNPLLFNMLYRMKAVEHIGSGIGRIRYLCKEYGIEEPLIEISPHWFTIVFKRPMAESETDQEETNLHVTRLITRLQGEMSREELMSLFNFKDRKYFVIMYIKPALNTGYIEMTVPEKPRSKNQKYRLTDKGEKLLSFLNKKEQREGYNS